MFLSRSLAAKTVMLSLMVIAGTTLLFPELSLLMDSSKSYAFPLVADLQFGGGSNLLPSRDGSIIVPLKQDERALMLDASIDHSSNVTLVLDTGATYTSISREVAEQLGYDLENGEKIWVTTANGRVAMPKITIKSLNLNGFVAHDIEATVMDLPPRVPFSGLLGLSFIKRHRITIDTDADNLIIEPETQQVASS